MKCNVEGCKCTCHVTFRVGERVAAYDYKGDLVGRGRVVASQLENGLYMKVKLDGGVETVVPQAKAKRLVKKA